jgi:hypothetical protein
MQPLCKDPIYPCISPAATLVTSSALQPSYSDPCYQSRYYRTCRHKSSLLCGSSYCYGSDQLCDYFRHHNTCQLGDYLYCQNRDRYTAALAAMVVPITFPVSTVVAGFRYNNLVAR